MKRAQNFSFATAALLACGAQLAAQGPTTPLPNWTYTTTADKDGGSYAATIIGRSPLTRPHSVTVIPTQLIPVILRMPDGAVFDATAKDACSGVAPIDDAAGSPVFDIAAFTMNGVYMGTTQYIDAYQRANFWQPLGAKSSYRTLFALSVLPPVNITLSSGSEQSGTCPSGGQTVQTANVNQGDINTALQAVLPSLGPAVNPATFPIFVFPNMVMGSSIGFHSGYDTGIVLGGNKVIQTYGVVSWISGGYGYSANRRGFTLSHEVAEWLNDPFAANMVPAWHNPEIGGGGCDTRLEVADGLNTPSPPFPAVTMKNGLTYNMSELQFISWFFNTSSIGAGGKFSDNGTSTSMASTCP
jgi:hypothetical protein